MMKHDAPTPVLSHQRAAVAASPEWRNLLSHFELAPEGFAFIVLLVPDGDWAAACRDALGRFLITSRKEVFPVTFHGPEEFRDEMASRLLSMKVAGPEVGAVWVEAAVPEAIREYPKWKEAWRVAASRLNQYRNPLRRQFDVPLLFVGAPWVQVTLREAAPDLWSIRTMVVRIEPPVDVNVDSRRGMAEQRDSLLWSPEGTPDPEFALREAERLRGRPGKELQLSNLLYRAGLGYLRRNQRDEAARAFREAAELGKRFGANPSDLARVLSYLAEILTWKLDYDQAVDVLLDALRLCQQNSDIHGEATCIKLLGDVALSRSHYDEARSRFEQALALYQTVSNVLGEANCIDRLGDIAFSRSQFNEARSRFEQALALYRQVGNVLGEANSIMSLGDIALDLSTYDEARSHYEQALALYRRIGNVLGEANCIDSLGDIALQHDNVEEAHQLFEQALALHRQVGNIEGEANSIKSLGDIAAEHEQYGEARSRFEQALALHRQVGNIQGEANCTVGLGDIALAQGRMEEARQSYIKALNLYQQIPEPYSIGHTHQRLARLATDEAERQGHIQAAREAWESIGFMHMIEAMDKEFAAPG